MVTEHELSFASLEATAFDSLVLPLDFSPTSDRVLYIARALAQRADLPVHLVTTTSPGLDTEDDEAELALRAERLAGCRVDATVLPSNEPAVALGEFAARIGAPLICLSTHGRRALGEMVLGSMAHDLLKAQRVPLLVVGPHAEVDRWAGGHLLVAIDDGTLDDTPILSVASQWHSTFDGSIEVFEAVDDLRRDPGADPTPAVATAASLLRDATMSVRAAKDPAHAIVDAATIGTVIAVGSRLRKPLHRAVLGSVAWEVVRTSAVPVLIVPTLHASEE